MEWWQSLLMACGCMSLAGGATWLLKAWGGGKQSSITLVRRRASPPKISEAQRQRLEARAAVSDMVTTRHRIREEEAAQWVRRWMEADGELDSYFAREHIMDLANAARHWKKEDRPAKLEAVFAKERERRRTINRLAGITEIRAMDGRVVTRYWDGRHMTTCPYECDCPSEFRRRA